MSNQNQRKKYVPIVFDDPKLRLYGFPLQAGGKKPSFKWRLIENNPAIEIDYGYQDERGNRVSHQTPMDPLELNRVALLIHHVAKSKVPINFTIDNWGHPFIWDKELRKSVRSKEKMNLSQLEVGKKETGEVYITYNSYKKPAAEFIFSDGDWHQLQQSGTPAPTGINSPIIAMSWANLLSQVYNSYYATNWEEPEWRRKFREEMAKKFAGGGGQQQQAPQQQPQQQSAPQQQWSPESSFDDEIEFD